MASILAMFPAQGSKYVGMGKDLCEANAKRESEKPPGMADDQRLLKGWRAAGKYVAPESASTPVLGRGGHRLTSDLGLVRRHRRS
jgi:hypothetical protein